MKMNSTTLQQMCFQERSEYDISRLCFHYNLIVIILTDIQLLVSLTTHTIKTVIGTLTCTSMASNSLTAIRLYEYK